MDMPAGPPGDEEAGRAGRHGSGVAGGAGNGFAEVQARLAVMTASAASSAWPAQAEAWAGAAAASSRASRGGAAGGEDWQVLPPALAWRAAASAFEFLCVGLVLGLQSGGLKEVMSTMYGRLYWGLLQLPSPPSRWSLWLLLGCALVGGSFGAASKIFTGFAPPWNPVQPWTAWGCLPVMLLVPGLLEELWFRVALLPATGEGTSEQMVLWSAFWALAIFIAYHLNLIHARAVFRDGRLLVLAALLGVACTGIFYGCGCSVWPPAVLHGAAVWFWIFCLGGYDFFDDD
mmetsp:Transcript_55329/g.160597  ORF Transcript_55329/g.160597 Transcript_55329/m.160597 type:complete len:288 (+) Transcript_55329:42-905(+)